VFGAARAIGNFGNSPKTTPKSEMTGVADLIARPQKPLTQKLEKGSWKRRMDMTRFGISRRKALESGACALAGAAALLVTARADAEPSTTYEEIVRRWYEAWEKKDQDQFETLMADNFTFTSAAGDDHISKRAFKTQCWDTQVNFIDRFDLERVFGNGNEAFVKYLCHTKNGKSFRNVEYFRLRDGKVEAIECYFGGKSTFPSAVSNGS
jgi:ketosteroid isomerase-like protein